MSLEKIKNLRSVVFGYTYVGTVGSNSTSWSQNFFLGFKPDIAIVRQLSLANTETAGGANRHLYGIRSNIELNTTDPLIVTRSATTMIAGHPIKINPSVVNDGQCYAQFSLVQNNLATGQATWQNPSDLVNPCVVIVVEFIEFEKDQK